MGTYRVNGEYQEAEEVRNGEKKKASERIEGALAGTRKFIFTGRRLRSVS